MAPQEAAQVASGDEPERVAPGEPGLRQGPSGPIAARTRTATTFAAAAVGLVVSLLMLVFVLQNGDPQDLEFLWADFTLPAGAALLLAAIAGGLIVSLLGLARVLQLRLAARRHRAADQLAR